MWDALTETQSKQEAGVTVSSLARNKLFGSLWLPRQPAGKSNSLPCLAVADVRLCLDYLLVDEGYETERALIASHMRIAYSAPAHRNHICSGYPSEPVLASVRTEVLLWQVY